MEEREGFQHYEDSFVYSAPPPGRTFKGRYAAWSDAAPLASYAPIPSYEPSYSFAPSFSYAPSSSNSPSPSFAPSYAPSSSFAPSASPMYCTLAPSPAASPAARRLGCYVGLVTADSGVRSSNANAVNFGQQLDNSSNAVYFGMQKDYVFCGAATFECGGAASAPSLCKSAPALGNDYAVDLPKGTTVRLYSGFNTRGEFLALEGMPNARDLVLCAADNCNTPFSALQCPLAKASYASLFCGGGEPTLPSPAPTGGAPRCWRNTAGGAPVAAPAGGDPSLSACASATLVCAWPLPLRPGPCAGAAGNTTAVRVYASVGDLRAYLRDAAVGATAVGGALAARASSNAFGGGGGFLSSGGVLYGNNATPANWSASELLGAYRSELLGAYPPTAPYRKLFNNLALCVGDLCNSESSDACAISKVPFFINIQLTLSRDSFKSIIGTNAELTDDFVAYLTADIQRRILPVCAECIVTVSASMRVISFTSGARILQGALSDVTVAGQTTLENAPKTITPTFSEALINSVRSGWCERAGTGSICVVTASGYLLYTFLQTSPILGIALGISLGVFAALYLVILFVGCQQCDKRAARQREKTPTWRAELKCYPVRVSCAHVHISPLTQVAHSQHTRERTTRSCHTPFLSGPCFSQTARRA
jgi:hypothetical protein